ncbi:hypothetical protein PT2222_100157 [Paraburkholderia tropica]
MSSCVITLDRRRAHANPARQPHGRRAHQHHGPVGCAQRGPHAENIVIGALDEFEHAQAAVHHAAQFQPEAPRHAQRERRAAEHQRARFVHLMAHQRAPRVVHDARGDLRLGDVETLALGLRQVHAAALPVGGHVLQERDELQRRADRIGVGEIRGRGLVDQLQHQVPDRIRRAVAEVEQREAVGVTRGVDVLIERRHEIVERLQRQTAAAHHVGEPREQHRMHGRRAAFGDGVEPVAEVGEPRMALLRKPVAFVGDVVERARDMVDHADRRAQRLRQQQLRYRKFVVVVGFHGVHWGRSRPASRLRADGGER